MIYSITFLTKNDPEFKNRKRSNIHAKECFDNNFFTSNMLDHIINYYDNDMDEDELEYCKNILNKDEHYRNQRWNRLE